MNKLNYVLFIVLFVFSSQPGFADENINQHKKKNTDLEQFTVEQNRVTGDIDNLPLGTVLEKFQERTGLKYKMPEDMKSHLVSVNVNHLDIETALKRILSPYNHVLSKDEEDDNYLVSIIGHKLPVSETEPFDTAGSDQRDFGALKEADEKPAIAPSGHSTPDVEEIDFELANRNEGPPAELHHLFYPEMDEGTELTGPTE